MKWASQTVKQLQQPVNHIHRDTNDGDVDYDDDDDVCPRYPHYKPNIVPVSLWARPPFIHNHVQLLHPTVRYLYPVSLAARSSVVARIVSSAEELELRIAHHVDMGDTKWELTTCQRCTMIHLEPDAINPVSVILAPSTPDRGQSRWVLLICETNHDNIIARDGQDRGGIHIVHNLSRRWIRFYWSFMQKRQLQVLFLTLNGIH